MNLKRRSASRGELTGAMGATIQTVRKHEQQLAALIAGMQQLMDGQAALGEAFGELKRRMDDQDAMFGAAAKSLRQVDQIAVPLTWPRAGHTSQSNT